MTDAAPKPAECDSCKEPAKYLNYRDMPDGQRVELKACVTHDRLCADYRGMDTPLRKTEINLKAKEQWMEKAIKTPAKAIGEQLMSPDRQGQYHSRQLSWREKNRDQLELQRQRPGLGRSL